MKYKERILTLLVEIDDNDKPHWIWDSHKSCNCCYGICIKAICEGNQLKDIEEEDDDE